MLTDRYSIREKNEQYVISIINQKPKISRAEVAKESGLNKATVSDIVNKLVKEKLLIEVGSGISSVVGGRKPILLQLNKQAGVSLSIDLGYDYLSVVLTNLNGELLDTYKEVILITKENVVDLCLKTIEGFQKKANHTPYGIVGVAIAIHGIVYDNSILFTPYYDLNEIDLYSILTEKTGLPIHLENEANLTALAEVSHAPSHNNIVSISIHSGIGAGIIIDSELYYGRDGRSGEIGHTILFPDGTPCPCGNRGCLEQYSSEKAILQKYNKLNHTDNLTLRNLKIDFYHKESIAVQLIQQFASFIATGINNVIVSFGPENVYVNSNFIIEIPEILSLIENEMDSSFSKNVPILLSKLGENAILIGATALNLQEFFHIPSVKLELSKSLIKPI